MSEALFHDINACPEQQGIQVRLGIMVDATIVQAASSTKNKIPKTPELERE